MRVSLLATVAVAVPVFAFAQAPVVTLDAGSDLRGDEITLFAKLSPHALANLTDPRAVSVAPPLAASVRAKYRF